MNADPFGLLTPSSYQEGLPMTAQIVSRRIAAIRAATPVLEFLRASPQARRQHEPGVANFLVGNPHEMPLPGFVDALRHWSVPQNKDWFAYTNNDPKAQAAVAAVLRDRPREALAPDEIFLRLGAPGGLALTLGAVVDPRAEGGFISPPWFFHE